MRNAGRLLNEDDESGSFQFFFESIISNSCFAHLLIHNPAASQKRKQLK
jgi:hypothetical protein